MNTADTSEERKIWLDFIKEVKNSQYNKLNSSSIKIGTIIAFMATTIIFIVNGLPSVKPSTIKVYYLLIIFNFLMGAFLVLFNIFNSVFRRDLVNANILERYSDIKKQYMAPYILASMIQLLIWIGVNILISVLFFRLDYLDFYLFLPSIVYFVVGIKMFGFSLKPIYINYLGLDQLTIKKGNYFFTVFHVLSLISIPYYCIMFYSSGFIFSNKTLFIYALYFMGLIFASNYFARYLSYKIIYSWIDRIYIDLFSGAIYDNNLRKEIFSQIKSIND